jgi:hypothetical protein
MSNGTSKLGRDSPEGHAFQRRANTRDERAAWERIGVNEGRARTVFDLAGSAGCELWLNGPSLEIDIPHTLPKKLRDRFFLHLFLDGRTVATLLEAEGAAL